MSLYKALAQARQDADVSQVPAVMHRTNKKPWVIIVEVEQLIRLLDVVIVGTDPRSHPSPRK